MTELILIMCYMARFADNPNEFCYLQYKPSSHTYGVTVQDHCDYRKITSLNYELTLCREFKNDEADRELLK